MTTQLVKRTTLKTDFISSTSPFTEKILPKPLIKFNFSNAFSIIRAHLSFYKNYSKIKGKRPKKNLDKKYYETSNLPFNYFFIKKKNL